MERHDDGTDKLVQGITVGELIKIPHLQTRVVAGGGGLGRRVSWAHVTDVEEVWDWHDAGNLIMSSGVILPRGAAEQAEFVARLDAAGMSGLIAGNNPVCPPLHPEMLEAADRLDFPLLEAAYEVSFTEHVRAVAAANQRNENKALRQIAQVHDEVRLGLSRHRSSREFVEGLSRVVGAPTYVVEAEWWEPTLPGCPIPAREWQQALRIELMQRDGRVPLLMRLTCGDELMLATPVPVGRDVMLLVLLDQEDAPRLTVLQHVAAACALEVARVDAGLERDRRAGTALLAEALQGRVDAKILETHLIGHGLEAPCLCLAFDASPATVDHLARRWGVAGVPHLLGGVEPTYLALVRPDDALLDELTTQARERRFHVGVSDAFSGASGLGDAARQARWALEAIRRAPPGLAHYGDDHETFLPRTLTESQVAARRVLGPVLDYDAAHDASLIQTLETYLLCDRSPKRAAELLLVHTQTVNYRIGRIQMLSGRSMRSTADISELWFGLRALALSETLARKPT